MTHYFGLYFGNTNMCLAVHKDSKVEVLANAAGYRVTPSVIAFINDKEKIVGLDAKNALKRNATGITNVKDILNSTATSETDIVASDSSKLNGKKNNQGDTDKNTIILQYGLTEILSMLFSTLKDIACSFSHEDVYPTVVSVPLSFTSIQRKIVRKSVEDAGFQLLRIISEPAAAALAYNVGQKSNDSNSKCMVFRMGGTSLDVTVLDVSNGMYSVLSSVQKKNFGGHQITDVIVDFCSSEFQRQYRVNIKENKRSLMKLRTAAELYKHVVHSSMNERCQAESVYEGIDLNINISKARFDSLIHNTIYQCLEPINEALKKASLSESDINQVILAGGSCKIPKLQQLISNTFSSASVLYNICPDEVVAVGAALQAILVNECVEDECFVSLLSQDISIKVTGVLDSSSDILLCCQGTLIPTVITQSFTVTENSSCIKVEMWEGPLSNNTEDTRKLLAVLNMTNLPVGEIFFSFHIRSDGSVHVTCKDCASKELGSTTVIPSHTQGCT